jgi:hypothetical protein
LYEGRGAFKRFLQVDSISSL